MEQEVIIDKLNEMEAECYVATTEMTFGELDEIYEKTENMEHIAEDWVPDEEILGKILTDPIKHIPFMVWFTETCKNNDEQKEIKKMFNDLLKECIVIKDDEYETED